MKHNRYTIAVLTAKEGLADELLATLSGLAESTRAERGCIEYGFYQDEANPNQVLSFERWVDRDAESTHWQTKHLNAALRHLESVLEREPQIYKAAKVI